jgi:glycine cleavage system H protein
MDGFSYTNIFETKGIEYIAIIVFFLALIPFWTYLIKSPAVKRGVKKVMEFFSFEKLRIPEGIYYDKAHTWTFLEKNGTASVGADDFLVQLTGAVKLNYHKQAGDFVKKGEVLADAEKDGKSLQLVAPVSGEIRKTNDALSELPELLTEDPYGKGWIYKVKPYDWKNDTKDHLLADEAKTWSKNEVTRFKDFLSETYAKESGGTAVLQDGGELAAHTLSLLPENVWKNFQKEFLNPAL